MSMLESSPTTPLLLRAEVPLIDDAQLAAVAFLARHGGRTLESDCPTSASTSNGLSMSAWRRSLPIQRMSSCTGLGWRDEGWPVDDRPAALDGVWILPFAHIGGRITSNAAQYVRRPRAHPTTQRSGRSARTTSGVIGTDQHRRGDLPEVHPRLVHSSSVRSGVTRRGEARSWSLFEDARRAFERGAVSGARSCQRSVPVSHRSRAALPARWCTSRCPDARGVDRRGPSSSARARRPSSRARSTTAGSALRGAMQARGRRWLARPNDEIGRLRRRRRIGGFLRQRRRARCRRSSASSKPVHQCVPLGLGCLALGALS